MLFFIVLLIEVLACAEVDIFVPSFPDLQALFSLTPFEVEMTMSVNLVTYCLGALWVGAMGDAYGRKPLIIWGLVLFSVGSLLCMGSQHFWMLLLGRALQGLGMAGPSTLGYVIIADHFSVQEQQEKMGTLNGVVSLSMAAAPVIGSYVTLFLGWRGNFAILLFFGVVCFLLSWRVIPHKKNTVAVKASIKDYKVILKNKEAMLYVYLICFLVISYWVFIAISPILYMEDLGVSLKHFGFFQGVSAASFACLSFSSPFLLQHLGQKRCLYMSAVLLFFFFLGVLWMAVEPVTSPWLITLIMVFMSVGIVMPINILWPMSLEILPEAKGRMSGLFVAARMILTSLGIQTVGYFYNGTAQPIGIFMVLVMLISLGLSYALLQKQTKYAS